jgi:putative pyruvate formate lyase activating enzyme
MDMKRRDFLQGCLWGGSSFLFSSSSRAAGLTKKEGWRPAYELLEREGEFSQRIKRAYDIFGRCELCPRCCGVNRLKGERGFCQAPAKVMVYSFHPHFGEETALVGEKGSGTIFFSNCNLRCVFCQNWEISHEGRGVEISDEKLAEMMIKLQKMGCHNINLVTPTHVMPNILQATRLALKKGLSIPLVYNTSGYERPEIITLLDGIVDIYLPDLKYMDPEQASKYSSGASDYPEITRKAILDMQRQVGVLQTDRRGIALRGLIIRHLVMPNRVAGTEKFLRWVSEQLPRNTYVNIMAQYRVEYKAYDYPEIARGVTIQEFLEAMDWAKKYGLTNLDQKSVMVRKIFQRQKVD